MSQFSDILHPPSLRKHRIRLSQLDISLAQINTPCREVASFHFQSMSTIATTNIQYILLCFPLEMITQLSDKSNGFLIVSVTIQIMIKGSVEPSFKPRGCFFFLHSAKVKSIQFLSIFVATKFRYGKLTNCRQ